MTKRSKGSAGVATPHNRSNRSKLTNLRSNLRPPATDHARVSRHLPSGQSFRRSKDAQCGARTRNYRPRCVYAHVSDTLMDSRSVRARIVPCSLPGNPGIEVDAWSTLPIRCMERWTYSLGGNRVVPPKLVSSCRPREQAAIAPRETRMRQHRTASRSALPCALNCAMHRSDSEGREQCVFTRSA